MQLNIEHTFKLINVSKRFLLRPTNHCNISIWNNVSYKSNLGIRENSWRHYSLCTRLMQPLYSKFNKFKDEFQTTANLIETCQTS